jgi:hypothetical protein
VFAGLRQKIRPPNACRPHVQGGRIDFSIFIFPIFPISSGRRALRRTWRRAWRSDGVNLTVSLSVVQFSVADMLFPIELSN